jgi:hypothetical protein
MRDGLRLGIAPPTARREINEKGGCRFKDMTGKGNLRLIRENQRSCLEAWLRFLVCLAIIRFRCDDSWPSKFSSLLMTEPQNQRIQQALDQFRIETPSWGFADTGTRFGKLLQDAAAIDINDKLADAGQVHAFTGFCPSVAVHVLWDFLPGQLAFQIVRLGQKYGVRIGAINPNLFQDQIYKYGSLCNRNEEVRAVAVKHLLTTSPSVRSTLTRRSGSFTKFTFSGGRRVRCRRSRT